MARQRIINMAPKDPQNKASTNDDDRLVIFPIRHETVGTVLYT